MRFFKLSVKSFIWLPGLFRQLILNNHFLISGMLIFISMTNPCRAQDLPYARYLVNKLTSEEFAGRGYVNDGNVKAARFIKNQFDSLGLLSFTHKKYTQPFSFPVNTFPSDMHVEVDGKKLVPGDDYIVNPYSSAANRKYQIKSLRNYSSSEIFNSSPEVCYTVSNDSLPENERAHLFRDLISGKIKKGALILLQPEKLTWSVAKDHYRIPVLSVLQFFLNENTKEISIKITEKFIRNFKTQNLVGYVNGSVKQDSFIVFCAHYDHLGMMGSETYFPGANDNASGIAMLLNLAQYFSVNQPLCSIAFIAFAGEEAGLVGSKYFTEHPAFPLSKINFLINLDLLGTGDDGMMVVNATENQNQFQLLDSLNTAHRFLPKLGQRGNAKNSDHYYFTEHGVPSFFFYTMGGIQAYHDINDKAETLPFTEFKDVFRLIVAFEEELR